MPLGNLAVVKFRKFWLLERDTLPVIKFPKFSVGILAVIKFPKFLGHARGPRSNKISEILVPGACPKFGFTERFQGRSKSTQEACKRKRIRI